MPIATHLFMPQYAFSSGYLLYAPSLYATPMTTAHFPQVSDAFTMPGIAPCCRCRLPSYSADTDFAPSARAYRRGRGVEGPPPPRDTTAATDDGEFSSSLYYEEVRLSFY